MRSKLQIVNVSGKEVYPIIEGGKGIGVTNGISAGYFAKAGAVGTFSGVNAQYLDDNGEIVPLIYKGKSRNERHEELMDHSIKGGITQAKIAHDISGGKGRIHMNVLWEMAGSERILHGILAEARGMIHGITCGAGMPYRLAPIAAKYKVFYYPIVSSMRAFRALWKRSYSKFSDYLGAVVYECPWKAGGHNGLSNAEDPTKPQDPYPRVVEIRKFMNEIGLQHVPIVMAGGVWHIDDYEDWLDNPDIGPIVFQFGTRPIVTKENPVPDEWKRRLLNLKEGDVYLNKFSPTGFYSSAVDNDFIKELKNREDMQFEFRSKAEDDFNSELKYGKRGRVIYVKSSDFAKAQSWIKDGYSEIIKTPDNTVIFLKPEKAAEVRKDQIDCMGCLSVCRFSNWSTHFDNFTTGKLPDPRSFCIQKTLQEIVHKGDTDNELMFAGHNAYRFASDPYYANNFIPTTEELVQRIISGK